MPYVFNPLTGSLEQMRLSTVEFAEKISSTFMCDVGSAVGDVVVPSTLTENKVDSISTNAYSNLAFGIIIEKIDPTTCEVLISGKLTDNISGLAFGKVAYISPTGQITTTVPTTGHLQKMGVAIKSGELFLLPSLEKVILS